MKRRRDVSSGEDAVVLENATYAFCLNKWKLTSDKQRLVIGMQPRETLHFRGMAKLRNFQGVITVQGYATPSDNNAYINCFAPMWSSGLVLYAADEEQARTTQNWTSLEDEVEIEADRIAEEMAVAFPIVLIFAAIPFSAANLDSCLTAIEDAKAGAVTGFKFFVPSDEVPRIPKCFPAIASDVQKLVSSEKIRVIKFPSAWQSVANALMKRTGASRTLICGSKGVGKSTFCRYMVNRLLKKAPVVAFLDIDVGQPEFTPSGLISLHLVCHPIIGPGHTHVRNPYRAYFYGYNSTKSDPMYFLHLLRRIVADFKHKTEQFDAHHEHESLSSDIPLVINTDGWVKGMGQDILTSAIQEIVPTDVVQIIGSTNARRFDVVSDPRWKVHTMQCWTSAATTAARSAKDLRQYRLQSYFLQNETFTDARERVMAAIISGDHNRISRHSSMALARLEPYEVSFQQIGLCALGRRIIPEEILNAFNGSIIGLCYSSSIQEDEAAPSLRIIQNAPTCVCFGIGLVRSICPVQQTLFILSPLPISILKRVNVLMLGNIPMHLPLLHYDSIIPPPYVTPNVLPSESSGATIMKSRNNLRRRKEGP